MAFNLYFAGSQCKEADELMVKLNCNRLFSQENDRKNISNWQNYKHSRRTQYKGNIFIDSGAFSVHTKGIELDVDEYINYINSIDDDIHIFAQVDKIPGEFGKEKTKEQILEAPKLSWDNYLYMKEKVVSRDKLLPIFHQGEDFKWLHNMLEYTHEDGSHIDYIGISPANDKSSKEKEIFIHKCFNIIKKSSNPSVKTHAFGMTSKWILERYPFTSADSTSWLMTGANGNIMTEEQISNFLEGNDRSLYRKWIPDNNRATGLFVYDVAIDLRRLFSVTTNQLEPEITSSMVEKLKEYGWKITITPFGE